MPNDLTRAFAPLPPDGRMGRPPEYPLTLSPAKTGRICQRTVSMPDDEPKTKLHAASRINIHEKYELEYWTKTPILEVPGMV